MMIENAYDVLLQTEHLRREQPPREDEEAWNAWYDNLSLASIFNIIINQGNTSRREIERAI